MFYFNILSFKIKLNNSSLIYLYSIFFKKINIFLIIIKFYLTIIFLPYKKNKNMLYSF